ncbi:hypothetical protein BFP72_14410 [Reichenbachiella sp. 5M10]|nr:hypothetical protein BFP72_14410 [Reichenbachiella sp. 5M10]
MSGLAQEKRVRDWKPSELFLSADVVGMARLVSGDVQTEFQAKVDFDHFYMAVDWGRSNLNSDGENFDYQSSGNFFRVGPQVNFTPYSKIRSSIYFGLMYAHSSFTDEINYFVVGDDWDNVDLSYENKGMSANWMEAMMGLNVRIVGPLFLGYTVRFKLAKWMSDYEVLQPYEIPGYGQADKSSVFGFNYYITYRFGFRKKPIETKPKRVHLKE